MKRIDWNLLDAAARAENLRRPAQRDGGQRRGIVRDIIARVRAEGDSALRDLTRELDGVALDELRVPAADIASSAEALTDTQRTAIETAHSTIRRFHADTGRQPSAVETVAGVRCRRVVRAIEAVGLYVPGGSAPLPSTTLMLGVPAELAGCRRVVLCSPPDRNGRIHPAILFAARCCGIDEIYSVGGAQAIAAMAFGTETLPSCDKVFGPGNAWVTEAKQQVASDPVGAQIDMPAGPSEVLVIADDTADANAVAADLLSQAEHGPDSQVILVALDRNLPGRVEEAVMQQLERLPRRSVASQALSASRLILAESREQAMAISNAYAPEHLIINTRDAEDWLSDVEHAGSVFLGGLTPESLGDYCSGTNHVLPTYGYARSSSGLSVADFQKTITVQEATAFGLRALGPVAITLAELEGLDAHADAVRVRLEKPA